MSNQTYPSGYVRNCLVVAGHGDGWLFRGIGDTVIARLDGYAIVPRGDYAALAGDLAVARIDLANAECRERVAKARLAEAERLTQLAVDGYTSGVVMCSDGTGYITALMKMKEFVRPTGSAPECLTCNGRGRITILRIGNEVGIPCPDCSSSETVPQGSARAVPCAICQTPALCRKLHAGDVWPVGCAAVTVGDAP